MKKKRLVKKGDYLLIENLAGCDSCPTDGFHKVENVDYENDLSQIKVFGFNCWLDDPVVRSWIKATKIMARFYGRNL